MRRNANARIVAKRGRARFNRENSVDLNMYERRVASPFARVIASPVGTIAVLARIRKLEERKRKRETRRPRGRVVLRKFPAKANIVSRGHANFDSDQPRVQYDD